MTTDDQTAPARLSLPVICPDYDEDCLDMTPDEARQCFEGFPNNPHMVHGGYGPEGMGRAAGVCPIIARISN